MQVTEDNDRVISGTPEKPPSVEEHAWAVSVPSKKRLKEGCEP